MAGCFALAPVYLQCHNCHTILWFHGLPYQATFTSVFPIPLSDPFFFFFFTVFAFLNGSSTFPSPTSMAAALVSYLPYACSSHGLGFHWCSFWLLWFLHIHFHCCVAFQYTSVKTIISCCIFLNFWSWFYMVPTSTWEVYLQYIMAKLGTLPQTHWLREMSATMPQLDSFQLAVKDYKKGTVCGHDGKPNTSQKKNK